MHFDHSFIRFDDFFLLFIHTKIPHFFNQIISNKNQNQQKKYFHHKSQTLKWQKELNNQTKNKLAFKYKFKIKHIFHIKQPPMINEISLNSSNTIELSRGQLLSWLNDLLGANITKIEQLGTGAFYCQMLDLLYPGKVQLSKVNFKAKNDYEYINNFKVLQQCFTKLGVMKNIEVERLVKCKYQDNLQFLQWFKKIFDNHYNKSDSESSMRRSVSDNNESTFSLQKENKKPTRALNFDESGKSNSMNELLKLQFSKEGGSQRPNHTATSRSRYEDKPRRENSLLKPSTDRNNSYETKPIDISLQNMQADQKSLPKSDMRPQQHLLQQSPIAKQPYYSPSKFIEKQNFYRQTNQQNQGFCNQEREFYTKKFKEIEHLLEFYENNQHCSKLVGQIRKVILMAPQINDWSINEQTGEVVCRVQPQFQTLHKEVSNFAQVQEQKLPVAEVQQ